GEHRAASAAPGLGAGLALEGGPPEVSGLFTRQHRPDLSDAHAHPVLQLLVGDQGDVGLPELLRAVPDDDLAVVNEDRSDRLEAPRSRTSGRTAPRPRRRSRAAPGSLL